jgi:hypothetical protein
VKTARRGRAAIVRAERSGRVDRAEVPLAAINRIADRAPARLEHVDRVAPIRVAKADRIHAATLAPIHGVQDVRILVVRIAIKVRDAGKDKVSRAVRASDAVKAQRAAVRVMAATPVRRRVINHGRINRGRAMKAATTPVAVRRRNVVGRRIRMRVGVRPSRVVISRAVQAAARASNNAVVRTSNFRATTSATACNRSSRMDSRRVVAAGRGVRQIDNRNKKNPAARRVFLFAEDSN